jgi:para-nitrobenzyl esterase
LRHLPLSDLVTAGSAIPGVIDGKVLTESIAKALRHGRFAHVPVLNGIVHNEEWLFVAGLGVAVSNGSFVGVPPVTPDNYTSTIATVVGVSHARAEAIATEYPVAAYGGAAIFALSTLLSDANFACPALRVDRWTSGCVPTFGYQFNDDNAPVNIVGGSLGLSTHGTELPYLFDQPNAPFPAMLTADQQALAASMRTAWASFAASGSPSTHALPWPSIGNATNVMSFVPLRSQVTTDFAAAHHCSFWAAG